MKSRLSAGQTSKPQPKRRKRSRRSLSYAIYSGLFVILAVFVATGYKMPKTETAAVNNQTSQTASANNTELAVVTPAEAQSANLAANVATDINLSAGDSVANKSVSLGASVAMEQPDATSASKPQIADPTTTPEPIISYVAQEGDTATTIAGKFGISDQTVRWANNLSSDAVAVGSTLTVPVIDGVVYEVKDGDDLSAIAGKYQSDVASAVAINNLDGVGASAGTKILLPDGVLPETERPGYAAPRSMARRTSTATSSASYYSSGDSRFLYRNTNSTSPGNRNYYGNCTWFAWEYRSAIGRPLPAVALGNANVWHITLAGYGVNRTPEVGAVQQTSSGWAGHVAVVVAIAPNGDVTVREMNAMGYNVVSERTYSAYDAGRFNYIH